MTAHIQPLPKKDLLTRPGFRTRGILAYSLGITLAVLPRVLCR